ncbi:MAG: T9SS type A sorting domain-containing protein [Chitinophagaceae bacterium]
MKIPTFLAVSLIAFASQNAFAQSYPAFTGGEDIDIANIRARTLMQGDMWWNPVDTTAACEFPKGSGKNIGYASSLWLSGFNSSSQLRESAQLYRTIGNDYWPGPYDNTDTSLGYQYAHSAQWAKIWKINSSAIDSFLKSTQPDLSKIPKSILDWPAIGNPYVQDANGLHLNIVTDMAPFVDVNGDGLYNPMNGDYPKMKGSQMLWRVFNDYIIYNSQTYTFHLGVDVKSIAYAYENNSLINNVVFYEYNVTNHSTSTYDSFRMGIFGDYDIGFAFDDFFGYDTARRMGVFYNGKAVDGNGNPGDYGVNPPMAGLLLLETPGDAYNSYSRPGCIFESINGSPNRQAFSGVSISNVMRQKFPDGTPAPDSFFYGADGLTGSCVYHNMPGDLATIISSKDYQFLPGESKKIAFALVASEHAGGCPNEDFTGILATADSAIVYYWNAFRHTPTAVFNTPKAQKLKVFPNPAKELLYVELPLNYNCDIRIYDVLGKSITLPMFQNGSKISINISGLSKGIYIIRNVANEEVQSNIFVKE